LVNRLFDLDLTSIKKMVWKDWKTVRIVNLSV
jgi:hypothetical protein